MSRKYNCKCCNFHSHLKSDYVRHMQTIKHFKLSSQYNVNKEVPDEKYEEIKKPEIKDTEHYYSPEKFICIYCKKEFSRKSSMDRHIKYSCKNSNDEDMKELVRLLNQRDSDKSNKINTMKSQIHRLTRKLQLTNISSFNNNV